MMELAMVDMVDTHIVAGERSPGVARITQKRRGLVQQNNTQPNERSGATCANQPREIAATGSVVKGQSVMRPIACVVSDDPRAGGEGARFLHALYPHETGMPLSTRPLRRKPPPQIAEVTRIPARELQRARAQELQQPESETLDTDNEPPLMHADSSFGTRSTRADPSASASTVPPSQLPHHDDLVVIDDRPIGGWDRSVPEFSDDTHATHNPQAKKKTTPAKKQRPKSAGRVIVNPAIGGGRVARRASPKLPVATHPANHRDGSGKTADADDDGDLLHRPQSAEPIAALTNASGYVSPQATWEAPLPAAAGTISTSTQQTREAKGGTAATSANSPGRSTRQRVANPNLGRGRNCVFSRISSGSGGGDGGGRRRQRSISSDGGGAAVGDASTQVVTNPTQTQVEGSSVQVAAAAVCTVVEARSKLPIATSGGEGLRGLSSVSSLQTAQEYLARSDRPPFEVRTLVPIRGTGATARGTGLLTGKSEVAHGVYTGMHSRRERTHAEGALAASRGDGRAPSKSPPQSNGHALDSGLEELSDLGASGIRTAAAAHYAEEQHKMSSEPGRPVLLLDKSGEAEPDPLRPPLQVHVFTKVRNGVGLENLHPLPEPEPEPESEPEPELESSVERDNAQSQQTIGSPSSRSRSSSPPQPQLQQLHVGGVLVVEGRPKEWSVPQAMVGEPGCAAQQFESVDETVAVGDKTTEEFAIRSAIMEDLAAQRRQQALSGEVVSMATIDQALRNLEMLQRQQQQQQQQQQQDEEETGEGHRAQCGSYGVHSPNNTANGCFRLSSPRRRMPVPPHPSQKIRGVPPSATHLRVASAGSTRESGGRGGGSVSPRAGGGLVTTGRNSSSPTRQPPAQQRPPPKQRLSSAVGYAIRPPNGAVTDWIRPAAPTTTTTPVDQQLEQQATRPWTAGPWTTTPTGESIGTTSISAAVATAAATTQADGSGYHGPVGMATLFSHREVLHRGPTLISNGELVASVGGYRQSQLSSTSSSASANFSATRQNQHEHLGDSVDSGRELQLYHSCIGGPQMTLSREVGYRSYGGQQKIPPRPMSTSGRRLTGRSGKTPVPWPPVVMASGMMSSMIPRAALRSGSARSPRSTHGDGGSGGGGGGGGGGGRAKVPAWLRVARERR